MLEGRLRAKQMGRFASDACAGIPATVVFHPIPDLVIMLGVIIGRRETNLFEVPPHCEGLSVGLRSVAWGND